MRKLWNVVAAAVLAVAVVVGSSPRVINAEEHHVVGGDRGWEVSNDIASWSSNRIFSVGDIIWFTYSAAQESIVELGSKKEYLSCDLANPIRMYTDGLNKIPLDGEGIRYFASGNLESCKNGLKLPISIHSSPQNKKSTLANPPDAPVVPSASTRGLFPILLPFGFLPLAMLV